MGKPTVTSITAVNNTIPISGTAQILVAFTPADDAADLWFRFDLIPGSHSPLEGTWTKVSKTQHQVTLTFKYGSIAHIPDNWAAGTSISAQLVWGEHGTGNGGLIQRVPAMFTVESDVPRVISMVPVTPYLAVGAVPELRITYEATAATYFRVDIRPDVGLTFKPATWLEGTWVRISEFGPGQHVVDVAGRALPANWNPDQLYTGSMSGIDAVDGQIVYSKVGSGSGGLLLRSAHMWRIIAPGDTVDPEDNTTPDAGNNQAPATPPAPSPSGGTGADGTVDSTGVQTSSSMNWQTIAAVILVVIIIAAVVLMQRHE